MQITNNQNTYGWVSIFLHWVLALSIFGLFALGVWMVDLDYYSTWYHDAPNIHKSIGVLVISAMLFRFLWNQFNSKPAGLDSPSLNLAAKSAHSLMYLLVFALGVSGYLISTAESAPISVFGWFEVPALITPFVEQADIAGDIHEWLAYGLITLVVVHFLAAMKHHFINKDKTLKRMLKPIDKD